MGFRAKIAGLGLALLGAAGAHAQQMQIQFAEKVSISPSAGHTEFDAYGRRFSLELAPNDRLLAKLSVQRKAQLAGYRLWRGTLSGQPGSWVRLTEFDGRVEGAIWDGHDFYAVTSYEKIAAHLGYALEATPGATVVFRLSDAINILPKAYCALERSSDGLAPNNGLVQYRKLVAEIGVRAEAALTMSKQVEISLIADSAMAALVPDATAELLTSFNTVDGIYSEQVGLLILPTDVRVIPAAGDPFTETAASPLLAQLSTYRQNTPAIRSLGIAHLVTGKDLDADTVGIARLSGVCDAEDGVSLSEGWRGSFTTGLVMAHELGHNLGAGHDGVPGDACPTVPQIYLMAPDFNFSSTFSQCSLDTMRPVIAAAACITPAMYAHVELPVEGPPIFVENDNPVVLPFIVNSTGTQPAQGVKLNIAVPASVTVTQISPAGVCTAGPSGLVCDLGTIAAGQTHRVDVTFLPSMLGSFTADATVSATNNQNTRDNSQHQIVGVLPNADASVAVTASATTVLVGDAVDVTITVRSTKSHAAQDVRVGLLSGGLTAISASVPGGSCDIRPDQTFCLLGDIPAGASRQIVVRTTAKVVGDVFGSVYLSSPNDSENINNNANFNVRINSVRDVGLDEITPHSFVQFGMPYEFKANLHSYGTQPIANVSVDVWLTHQTSGLNDVTSVTVGGVACTKVQLNNYRCEVGTLAAGELRLISIKGTATELFPLGIDLHSYSPDQDNTNDDDLSRTLTVRYGLDASVTVGNFIVGPESLELQGSVAVWSNGLQPTANAVMIVELPATLHFTRFFIQNTTSTCTLTDAQHLRCVYNIPSQSSYQDVDFYVIGDVAGSYQGKATVTLAGDENAANDTVQWPITISPIVDVGVRDITVPTYVIGGHDVVVPITIFTGTRAVPAAVATVSTQVAAQIAAITTSAGTCTRVDPQRFSCALGDLPGSSTVNLNATVTAAQLSGVAVFGVNVDAAGDNNGNNNTRSAIFNTAQPGDVRVAVAATTATGTAGTAFPFPSISVRRTGPVAQGKLEVTLPSGVNITSISGSIPICSGTTTLQCDLPGWDESQAIQLDLQLSAAAATTFTSTVRVSSINDSDNSNNETSVAVTVNAVTTPPPVVTPPANPPPSGGGSSGGGGGGGGGRFDWLALALLAMVAARRQRQRFDNHRR